MIDEQGSIRGVHPTNVFVNNLLVYSIKNIKMNNPLM